MSCQVTSTLPARNMSLADENSTGDEFIIQFAASALETTASVVDITKHDVADGRALEYDGSAAPAVFELICKDTDNAPFERESPIGGNWSPIVQDMTIVNVGHTVIESKNLCGESNVHATPSVPSSGTKHMPMVLADSQCRWCPPMLTDTDSTPFERGNSCGDKFWLMAKDVGCFEVCHAATETADSCGETNVLAAPSIPSSDTKQLQMVPMDSQDDASQGAMAGLPSVSLGHVPVEFVDSYGANRAPAAPQFTIFNCAQDSFNAVAAYSSLRSDNFNAVVACPSLRSDNLSAVAACPSLQTDSIFSFATVFEDRPRRRGVWITTAIVALAIQWIPLSQTRACVADWSEDGTLVDMTLIERLADHPKYGVLHLVQHCVYMWTAAALIAAHIDHRGRYQPGSKLQRWTWYYSCMCLARAVGYCSLNLVVIVCPADPYRIFKIIEGAASAVQVMSYLVFHYTALIKLWVLQQRRVAESCFVILCVCAASFLASICLPLAFPDWNSRIDSRVFTILSWLGALSAATCGALEIFAMLRAARYASAQVLASSLLESQKRLGLMAASWTRKTALVTAASGATTVFLAMAHVCMRFFFEYRLRHHLAAEALICSAVILDTVSNTAAAAVLSGYVGPAVQQNQERSFAVVGAHVVEVREMRVRAKLQEACCKRSSAAAAIQSLVNGRDATSILEQARARFRRIPWVVLRDLREHMNGGPIEGLMHSKTFYKYSEPCCLSECDAFLSHSWHDRFDLKWAALEKWCEEFKANRGRYPTLWVDKFCINQADIAADLECLPVFLAGCNSLLILCGHTYTRRLWCVLELYVFMMMQLESDVGRSNVQAFILAESDEKRDAITAAFVSEFDAEKCECFHPEDKARILAVIQSGAGGVEAFNARAKQLARSLQANRRVMVLQTLSTMTSTLSAKSQHSGRRRSKTGL